MAKAKQQSRNKKFIKDFGIYAIGEFGAKLITFLMIPLYTYFVEKPSDYGYFDLCLQVCMLLIPVITLQLRDGAFRHLLDTKNTIERSKIVTFVYRAIFQTSLIVILIALLISILYPVRYLFATVALLISMSFYEILAQVSRGLGNNKAFILIGLITSLGIGIFSLIFVAWLGMGILGIFLANILARIVALIIVEFWMRTFSQFFKIRIDIKTTSRDLIKYSLPLIPVTLCSLLPPMSDRLFLKHIMGLEYSGIYAISVRLTGLIHSLSIIFYQTWQENAIQQYNSPDRDIFFSKVFNTYIYVLAAVLIIYIFIIKICFSWIVATNYQACLTFIYPIGVICIIMAISNYFYLPYQCAKDTKSIVPSVIILAVTNVLLNSLLVPLCGIFGVILTGIIGYLLVTLYLWKDTKKYFTLHVHPRTIIPILIIIVSIIPFYYNPNHFYDAFYIVVTICILFASLPKRTRTFIIDVIKKIAPFYRTTF